jgi:hypothetical protein
MTAVRRKERDEIQNGAAVTLALFIISILVHLSGRRGTTVLNQITRGITKMQNVPRPQLPERPLPQSPAEWMERQREDPEWGWGPEQSI